MNEIAVVTEQDIPDILRMIHEIYSELPNKEWFSLDSDEEVTSYMMTGGFGLKAMCDGRLAGVFIARAKNLGDENLGYDLKFDEEQRKQSAHMEIAMVRKRIPRTGVTEKDDGRVRTDSERTGISLSAWNGTSGQCGKCEYIPEITV